MAAEMWAGRDYDLYIERTALMMPTIPVVVDGVSSTLIHLTTGPDGYEALVWRRGSTDTEVPVRPTDHERISKFCLVNL